MHSSPNNPKKSNTERKAKHIPSGYACGLICSFDATKNKHDFGRAEDCIERLCKKFKEYAMEKINYVEREMISLTDEENNSYEEQEVCHICKKEFITNRNDKVRDHCHYTGKFRGVAHSICNLRYKIPKEIPVVAHNTAYDHHSIIKQLSKEFGGQLNV